MTSIACCAGGIDANYEDPLLWFDPRGNLHLIYHIYVTSVPDSCVGSLVSAHGYSADGFTWGWSPVQPYDNVIEYDDGTSLLVSTRERPKLFFDAAGEPAYLSNGVCSGISQCIPTPCVNCKYNYADINAIVPLGL